MGHINEIFVQEILHKTCEIGSLADMKWANEMSRTRTAVAQSHFYLLDASCR